MEEGTISKQTTKKTVKTLNGLRSDITNSLKVLSTIKNNIPERLLLSYYAEYAQRLSGKREVILSLYLTGGNND